MSKDGESEAHRQSDRPVFQDKASNWTVKTPKATITVVNFKKREKKAPVSQLSVFSNVSDEKETAY